MSSNWVRELEEVGVDFGEIILEEQHERVVFLKNAQEMRLMVRVYGYPSDIDQYLEGIEQRLIFYAGDDLPPIDNISDDVVEDEADDAEVNSPLVIQFKLLHEDEFQPLAILIDPYLDVEIAASADAHHYVHGNRLVKTTILADEGNLKLYRGKPGQPGTTSRVARSGDPKKHITSHKDTYVKGFDRNGNVYDLFIKYERD